MLDLAWVLSRWFSISVPCHLYVRTTPPYPKVSSLYQLQVIHTLETALTKFSSDACRGCDEDERRAVSLHHGLPASGSLSLPLSYY